MEDKDGNPVGFELRNLVKPRKVNAELSISKDAYDILRQGITANGQDDKWIVFNRGSEFYFHRSWTGHRIYQVELSNLDVNGSPTEIYKARYFFVESDPEIYKASENDEEEATNMKRLIENLTKKIPN